MNKIPWEIMSDTTIYLDGDTADARNARLHLHDRFHRFKGRKIGEAFEEHTKSSAHEPESCPHLSYAVIAAIETMLDRWDELEGTCID